MRVFKGRSRKCNWIGASIGIFLTPFAVMLFDRREPITLVKGAMVTLDVPPSEYEKILAMEHPPAIVAKPGEKVVILWLAIENKACDGDVERRVVEKSGKVIAFERVPTVYHMEGNGVTKFFTKEFVLPDSISGGWSTYSTLGNRWCNPLQKYLAPLSYIGLQIPFYIVTPPRPEP